MNCEDTIFLHTNNEQFKMEPKKAIPFTTVSKAMKHLTINLAKDFKTCTLKTTKHKNKKSKNF